MGNGMFVFSQSELSVDFSFLCARQSVAWQAAVLHSKNASPCRWWQFLPPVRSTRDKGMPVTSGAVIQCWEVSAVLDHWSVGQTQNRNSCPEEPAEGIMMSVVSDCSKWLFVLLHANCCN